MHSVIVKLTRTTMIIPIVGALGVRLDRKEMHSHHVRWHAIIPWFLVWFVGTAALDTVGSIRTAWRAGLVELAIVLITVAIAAAIGLSTHLGGMRRAGYRPRLLRTLTWLTVAVTSLGLQLSAGSW